MFRHALYSQYTLLTNQDKSTSELEPLNQFDISIFQEKCMNFIFIFLILHPYFPFHRGIHQAESIAYYQKCI